MVNDDSVAEPDKWLPNQTNSEKKLLILVELPHVTTSCYTCPGGKNSLGEKKKKSCYLWPRGRILRALWSKSQRKTNTVWYHLHMKSKKVKLREIKSRVVVTKGQEWPKWSNISQRVQTSCYTMKRSGDLMYSIKTTANNTVLYVCKLLRE